MERIIRTCVLVLFWMCTCGAVANPYDIVIQGGRVIDPETNLDAIRNLGISGSQIAAISESPLEGHQEIDAAGLIVSPGFIDLHVHGLTNQEARYQIHDGVTTALELEWGVPFFDRWIESKRNLSLINYGASASAVEARMRVVEQLSAGLAASEKLVDEQGYPQARLSFVRHALTQLSDLSIDAAQTQLMNQLLLGMLDEGTLGIGLPLAYLPGASRDEVLSVFQSASQRSTPVFVHVSEPPGIDGIVSAVAFASATGAPLHIVHINSMALEHIAFALKLIDAARRRGMDVTTEIYPYTASSTRIEASLFADGWEDQYSFTYSDIQWQETGERLTKESFATYREQGGVVIVHDSREEWIALGLAHPDVAIASDGMPFSPGAHPRTAGTFARVLGRYAREEKLLSLNSAIRKITLLPAQRLESIAPSMLRKGRLQVGADADITIFNPASIIDTASFESGLDYSRGVRHVFVNGVAVLVDGDIRDGVFPGQPVLAE